jgi:D-glycero-D-manno-heptose 1,7-bisphosphate phosphatase
MKLIILDRDGVINHERADYVKSAEECVPIDGSIEAIVRLYKAGFTLVVATNQSGLARAKFDLDDLEAMHEKLIGLVEEQGGELGAIFYCPHAPEDLCKCRKPLPGLIDALEAEFNTSAQGLYFVGDSLRDLQAAQAKACKPLLVKTGRGLETLEQLQAMNRPATDNAAIAADKGTLANSALVYLDQEPIPVLENLAAAADFILAKTPHPEFAAI